LSIRLASVLMVATATLFFCWSSFAAGRPSTLAAVSVLDRTFACSVPVWGGIREAKLSGAAGIRAQPDEWRSLPHASVRAGSPYESLVSVAAGAPVPADLRSTIAIYTDLCKPAAARVPLTTRGLSGGAASQLGDGYSCEVAREIVVRLRAELRGSARLTARRSDGRSVLVTRVPVSVGQLAVRTRSGRLLAYAQVLESGRSRLFAARGCYSE
jgi:hypothetical protein